MEYLDKEGVTYLWSKIKSAIKDDAVTPLNQLQDEVVGQNGTLTVGVTSATLLKGGSYTPTANVSFSYKGKSANDVAPDVKNATLKFTAGNSASADFSGKTSTSVSSSTAATTNTTYTAQATLTYKGVTFTKSASGHATFYNQIYAGTSSLATLDAAGMKALTIKPGAKGNSTGTYSGTAKQGEYFYIAYATADTNSNVSAVSGFSNAKEGGFDVPMTKQAGTVTDGTATYTVYRSTSAFSAGSYNIVLS